MFAVLSSARKAFRRGVAALSLVALTACDASLVTDLGAGSGGPSVDPNAPIPVALLVPRSDAGAASVAQSLENAARLAIADLNGVRIDLRVYDTAGNAGIAASQAQKAVDEGAKIILGPLFGEAANAAGNAVADEGINVLAFSNNPSIAGGNVFVLGPTFFNTADRLLGYARARGRNSIVVVHPANTEGEFGRSAIQQAAERNGVRIAAVESFPFNEAGVAAAVPRVRGTLQSTGANGVFLTSTPAGALPLLLQLMPEAGISPQTTQYMGLARWDVPPQTLGLPGAQGGWFTLPDQNMQRSFTERYVAAFDGSPHPLAGLAFDGIAAVGALAAQGRRDALTGGALTQTAGFQGTGGVFRLLSDGTTERALAVATVRNNSVVILDPAPSGFGGAGF
ncbi:penicillin-binding protein activator [Aestuariicoccus sp. MJ-SS9]|uniref:penicillin-binding protein activator n=1 Tax=Aestuariicoccus sp. MJ-SS9 TaxID=3079855 RepID=UPI00290E99A2|nr:penicillin-binding protein activator [Aestuariicoccus sp. MJ-SS9]MDU8912907.1 penicillin-binding protein activator [Aestuariicoccus sp. MJ-SS9]